MIKDVPSSHIPPHHPQYVCRHDGCESPFKYRMGRYRHELKCTYPKPLKEDKTPPTKTTTSTKVPCVACFKSFTKIQLQSHAKKCRKKNLTSVKKAVINNNGVTHKEGTDIIECEEELLKSETPLDEKVSSPRRTKLISPYGYQSLNENPYFCIFCQRSFRRACDLKKHHVACKIKRKKTTPFNGTNGKTTTAVDDDFTNGDHQNSNRPAPELEVNIPRRRSESFLCAAIEAEATNR